jgi:hypothetical protein
LRSLPRGVAPRARGALLVVGERREHCGAAARDEVVEASPRGVAVVADAGAWEQLIGRTHRQGQLADEVEVYVFAHGAFADALETARERAKYIENTTGNTQKLLLASWLEPREVAAEGDDEAARAA